MTWDRTSAANPGSVSTVTAWSNLDYRVGEVLDAIDEAGMTDDTIVIFLSDNGPTTTGGSPDELYAGDPGPFRGELGDAYEGSIRTVGMIRWPGRIKPSVSNEMIAIHDIFPTLATMIDAKIPSDRPMDGVDRDFLLGRQDTSNRDHLLTFNRRPSGGGALEAVANLPSRVHGYARKPVDSGICRHDP